jgi:hypothetical protein
MRRIFTVVLILGAVSAFGQRPVITSVDLISTYPLNRILITGSGFDTNTANLVVWFDQVKGTVVRATASSVEVTVPASGPSPQCGSYPSGEPPFGEVPS